MSNAPRGQSGRVTVSLVGGRFDGASADAPRDTANRVLKDIWVDDSGAAGQVVALAEPGVESAARPRADRYRFESWAEADPVYRFAGETRVAGGELTSSRTDEP